MTDLNNLRVSAGFPDGLDSQSIFGLTPKQQQRTEMPISTLVECLTAPVTEVASTALKDDCDDVQAISLIDAAMQTVLDADDCTSAVWKTSAKAAIFFVGWSSLEVRSLSFRGVFPNHPVLPVRHTRNTIRRFSQIHQIASSNYRVFSILTWSCMLRLNRFRV